MSALSRHLALTAFATALLAQPAFAHAHFAPSHRGYYRHAHPRQTALRHRHEIASRRGVARRHWRHRFYVTVRASFDRPGSRYVRYADSYAAPMHSSWPRAGSVRRDFVSRPLFADSAPPSAWSDAAWPRDAWHSGRGGKWGFGKWGFGRREFAERSQFANPQFAGVQVQDLAEQAASADGVPLSLVERVIKRESGGNPRAVSRGNYGLMQIRLGTARAMGYQGSAAGLLDPATNVTYAVRYLAGAYRAAGGNEGRAVALYARGYHASPRVENASFYGSPPAGEAMWQTAGFYRRSGGAASAYRQRPRRHFVF